jgi:hypothetical protein
MNQILLSFLAAEKWAKFKFRDFSQIFFLKNNLRKSKEVRICIIAYDNCTSTVNHQVTTNTTKTYQKCQEEEKVEKD